MNENFQEITCRTVGTEIFKTEDIQTLWRGYGKIMRYGLKGGDRNSVVIKHVKLPDQSAHPCSWNAGHSYQRKPRSWLAN